MNTRLHFNAVKKPVSLSAGPAALILLFSAALVLPGCLSKPALKRQTYSLDSIVAPTNSPALNGPTVAIRLLEVCPIFDGRPFVYRTGADRYEADPYAGFLIPSSRVLEIQMRNYLRSSGAFKDVVEPGSRVVPDTVVEIYVNELYGDFRQAAPPTAVLSIQMLFFDAQDSRSNQPRLEKSYTRRMPVQHRNAPALVAGWNKALAEIMAEATSDFASIQQPQMGSSDSRSSSKRTHR